MKPINAMTQIEMAAYVQTRLAEVGIKVILSGGAATAYHCANKYVSHDIDLVNVYSVAREKIKKAMFSFGFIEETRYFRHPDSRFFIEFPPGPLTVGLEPVKEVVETELVTGVLRVISPTDSVKDRLAAFYHWGDEQCLHQAVLIKQTKEIDFAEIERWSVKEGKLLEFQRFRDEV